MFILEAKNGGSTKAYIFMKYPPQNIIFCVVSKYLDDETYSRLMAQIRKEFPKQDRTFISIIRCHFDFELMKDKPVTWQDIWIYNYLKYDWDNMKFKRSARLLLKYEKEIIIPSERFIQRAENSSWGIILSFYLE